MDFFSALFGPYRGFVCDPRDQQAVSQVQLQAMQEYGWLVMAGREPQETMFEYMRAAQAKWDASLSDRYAAFCKRLDAALAGRSGVTGY